MSIPFVAQVHTYYVVALCGAKKVKHQARIMHELHMTRDEARAYRQSADTLAHPEHYLYTETMARLHCARALAEWDAHQDSKILGDE